MPLNPLRNCHPGGRVRLQAAGTEPREAFGVRRIPALLLRAVRNSHTAPEYGALQTLRVLENLRENDRLFDIIIQRAAYHVDLVSRRAGGIRSLLALQFSSAWN